MRDILWIIYNDMLIEGNTLPESQKYRLLTYYRELRMLMLENKERGERYEKKYFMYILWEKESEWEQKIYGKMKEWERRHPLIGMMLCAVLGGILVSLIADIILQGILMCI